MWKVFTEPTIFLSPISLSNLQDVSVTMSRGSDRHSSACRPHHLSAQWYWTTSVNFFAMGHITTMKTRMLSRWTCRPGEHTQELNRPPQIDEEAHVGIASGSQKLKERSTGPGGLLAAPSEDANIPIVELELA